MNEIWDIIREIVLPHTGRIILNIVGFSLLGALVATLLLIVYFRMGVMTRPGSTYRIAIRVIYIPLVILVTLYSFGHFGLVRGVYKVVSAETPRAVEQVYSLTAGQIFSTDDEKRAFLRDLSDMAQGAENSGLAFTDRLEQKVAGRYSGKKDHPGLFGRLARTYKKEIYKAVLHGTFYAAGLDYNAGATYAEMEQAMQLLNATDVQKIEAGIRASMLGKFQEIVDHHYYGAALSILLLWLLGAGIPLIDLCIYRIVKRTQKPAPAIGTKDADKSQDKD